MEADLQAENDTLQKEVKKLKAALKVLVEDDPSSKSDDKSTLDGSDTVESDGETENLPDAIWDDAEEVFRCSNFECGWEVMEGICQSCATYHSWNADENNDSIENEAHLSDRRLVQRGTTPLYEVGTESIPEEYGRQWNGAEAKWEDGREVEYLDLLQRGATRLMCETFHLEFKADVGIVAWADSRVYETFAGPGMQQGDFWKIYLGRRIQLDPEDLDGSLFLEGLLEDVLFYPLVTSLTTHVKYRWHTCQEAPGIWATRPLRDMDPATDEESDSADEETPEEGSEVPLNLGDTQDQSINEDTKQAEAQDDGDKLAPVKSADQYESDDDTDVDIYQSDWEIDPYSSDNSYDSSDEGGPDSSTDDEGGEDGTGFTNARSAYDSDDMLSGDEAVLKQR